jgi:hypothetical protein
MTILQLTGLESLLLEHLGSKAYHDGSLQVGNLSSITDDAESLLLVLLTPASTSGSRANEVRINAAGASGSRAHDAITAAKTIQ